MLVGYDMLSRRRADFAGYPGQSLTRGECWIRPRFRDYGTGKDGWDICAWLGFFAWETWSFGGFLFSVSCFLLPSWFYSLTCSPFLFPSSRSRAVSSCVAFNTRIFLLLRFVLPTGCWCWLGFSFLVVMLASWEGKDQWEFLYKSGYSCVSVPVSLNALLRQVVRYLLV